MEDEDIQALVQTIAKRVVRALKNLGHFRDESEALEEMAFYQLSHISRAALYLRTKKRFSYSSISLILGEGEGDLRVEVERAREFLLGRSVKAVDWNEDNF